MGTLRQLVQVLLSSRRVSKQGIADNTLSNQMKRASADGQQAIRQLERTIEELIDENRRLRKQDRGVDSA